MPTAGPQHAEHHAVETSAGKQNPASSLAECLDSYLREIVALPLLTPVEERRLARQAADGDKAARRQLISANLRLAVAIAKRYAAYGLPFCDLIQEGNLGLLKAAERFDWQRGTKFSTYAGYWIRESIMRTLTKSGRPVSLSDHAFKRFRKLRQAAEALSASLSREPTLSEIAAALQTTPVRAARILAAAAFPASPPTSEEERKPNPLEEIACECGCDPAEAVLGDPTPDLVRQAIHAALDDRERWIITQSFGLDGAPPQKLRQMAQVLEISVERVRQLRERALAKLRRHLAPAS